MQHEVDLRHSQGNCPKIFALEVLRIVTATSAGLNVRNYDVLLDCKISMEEGSGGPRAVSCCPNLLSQAYSAPSVSARLVAS